MRKSAVKVISRESLLFHKNEKVVTIIVKMVSFKLATSLLLATVGQASASYSFIAGYEPGSLVTDHVSISEGTGSSFRATLFRGNVN